MTLFGETKRFLGFSGIGDLASIMLSAPAARCMILESSETPLLICISVFASPRETNRMVDSRIATGNVLFLYVLKV